MSASVPPALTARWARAERLRLSAIAGTIALLYVAGWALYFYYARRLAAATFVVVPAARATTGPGGHFELLGCFTVAAFGLAWAGAAVRWRLFGRGRRYRRCPGGRP